MKYHCKWTDHEYMWERSPWDVVNNVFISEDSKQALPCWLKYAFLKTEYMPTYWNSLHTSLNDVIEKYIMTWKIAPNIYLSAKSILQNSTWKMMLFWEYLFIYLGERLQKNSLEWSTWLWFVNKYTFQHTDMFCLFCLQFCGLNPKPYTC